MARGKSAAQSERHDPVSHHATDENSGWETIRSQDSLSQLLAKILDQLSVSAWLPSGVLVVGVVGIFALRWAGGDVAMAFENLSMLNLVGVIVLVGAIVLVTVVTQAFEFKAIRSLEGYWGIRMFPAWFADRRVRRTVRQWMKLKRKADELALRGYVEMRRQMAQGGVDQQTIDLLDGVNFGYIAEPSDDDLATIADWIDWRPHADPMTVRRYNDLVDALKRFPKASRRMLPTRLGNTLRAGEARAYKGDDLEGWIQRIYYRLPDSLRVQHDQHRRRLDIYSTLVIVSALLGVAAAASLWKFGWEYRWWVLGLALAGIALSYSAAIEAARGYATALGSIGKWEAQAQRQSTLTD